MLTNLGSTQALDRSEIARRAANLKPVFRERAAKCEKLRRITDETIADLIDSRILRTCQPARFGGSELGFDVLSATAFEVAQGDGAQAWVADVYSEHAYIVGLFPEEAQHDVWMSNPDALISSSIVPMGNRVALEKGSYRLSGRWPFVSGILHADWAFVGESVVTDTGKETFYFLVPKSVIRMDDDWHTLGMVGTGSNSIMLDDVVVPPHRVLRGRDAAEGRAPGARVNAAPVYRMPFLGFAQTSLASVIVGVALGMVKDFETHLRSGSAADLLLARLSEAAAETQAAKLLLSNAAACVIQKLTEGVSLGEADAVLNMRDTAFAVTLAKRAANRLFEATGGRGLYVTAPLQRAFRDVMASAAHGSLNWERSALRYAKHALKV